MMLCGVVIDGSAATASYFFRFYCNTARTAGHKGGGEKNYEGDL